MFRLLITVNGVGPKGALGILSVMDVDSLRFAILSDDAKSISRAPGIGSKTAGKVILELKDKCHLEDMLGNLADTGEEQPAGAVSGEEEREARNDAVQALVALGYTAAEAAQAVRAVKTTADMTVEEILKQSLKTMG